MKPIIVIGPEGSGTNLLTDIVAELTELPRNDPSALHIRNRTFPEGYVHHVSLPSHRPVVWVDLNGVDATVIGIIRQKIDAVYSTWRRFSTMPMTRVGPPTLNDYCANYDVAEKLTRIRSLVTVSYEGLCCDPDGHTRMLCANLGVRRRTADELTRAPIYSSGKWRDNKEFLGEWLRCCDDTGLH